MYIVTNVRKWLILHEMQIYCIWCKLRYSENVLNLLFVFRSIWKETNINLEHKWRCKLHYQNTLLLPTYINRKCCIVVFATTPMLLNCYNIVLIKVAFKQILSFFGKTINFHLSKHLQIALIRKCNKL